MSINRETQDELVINMEATNYPTSINEEAKSPAPGLTSPQPTSPREKEELSDSSSSSGLSEISNEGKYFNKKVSYQRRALFRKSVSLQVR